MTPLENYSTELLAAQEAERKRRGTYSISRVENPAGTCKTLWIPVLTWNRTATINLNHQISGFDKDGCLWGENGNCETPYRIIQIPDDWTDAHVEKLAEVVAKKLNKPEGYPVGRVLKADERMQIILESILDV